MNLVLGLHGLPEAEASLVKTIVRLSSNLLTPWTVIDSGRCDAQLVDFAEYEAGESPGLQPGGVKIAVLRRGQPAEPSSLSRPIRAEELIERLNQAAPRCLAGRSREESVDGSGSVSAASAQAAGESTAPDASTGAAMAPADASSNASPVGRASASAPSQPACRSARLRRWPPHALLSGRPGYVQMATLLSRTPMSAARLAALSSRQVADCEAFLREMDLQQLLSWEPEPQVLAVHASAASFKNSPAASSAGSLSGSPAQPSAAAQAGRRVAPVSRSLLGLLRQKLGITGGRSS